MVRINIHISLSLLPSPTIFHSSSSSLSKHLSVQPLLSPFLEVNLHQHSITGLPVRHALHHCRLRHHGTTSSCPCPTELLPLTLRSHHQRSCIYNPDTSPPSPHLHHHNHRSQRHRHPNHCHRREHRDHHHRPYRPRTHRHFNRRCYPIV